MIKRLISLALWFACMLSLFSTADKLSVLCGTYSIRPNGPVQATAVQRLEKAAAEQGMCLSLWREETADVSANRRSTSATVIYCRGNIRSCCPATYLSGSAPGAAEAGGAYFCALSCGLAFRLFGGSGIIGEHVVLDGEEYAVSGVFEDDGKTMLLYGGQGQEYAAIELSGLTVADPRGQVQRLLQGAGISFSGSVLPGQSLNLLARRGCYLSLLAAVLFMLIQLLAAFRRRFGGGTLLWLLLGLGASLALCLPGILSLLPRWLIPSSWSDFSYWHSVFSMAKRALSGMLTLPVMPRYAELKELLARYAALEALALVFALTAAAPHKIMQKEGGQ